MSKREIKIWPEVCLTKVSAPIAEINLEIKDLVKDMIDTMIDEGNSVGIAAPQVGVNKRVFVVNILPENNDGCGTDGFEVFINPEIINSQGEFTWEEGCLSIPGERGKVTRFEKILMRYRDLDGSIREREAQGYLSGCFQHELDHLNGKLWIDYQSRLKRNLVKKKMLRLKKELENLPDNELASCQAK